MIYSFEGTQGLAIDQQYLYWGEAYWTGTSAEGRIRRSQHDGSQVEDVVVGIVPFQIAVDSDSNTVFWTDQGADGIEKHLMRANLDGSNIESIADIPFNGRGVAINSTLDKVYWVSEVDGIYRSNFDGSEPEFVVNVTGAPDFGTMCVTMALDGSAIYFGTFDSIWRADLDGSNPQRIIENAGHVQALVIVPEPATLSLFLGVLMSRGWSQKKKGRNARWG